METYNVVIDGETTGTISTDTLDGQHPDDFMGEVVTIHLHDENGNAIERTGKLTEVL